MHTRKMQSRPGLTWWVKPTSRLCPPTLPVQDVLADHDGMMLRGGGLAARTPISARIKGGAHCILKSLPGCPLATVRTDSPSELVGRYD